MNISLSRTAVAESEIERFQRDGYVVLHRLISPATARRWATSIEDASRPHSADLWQRDTVVETIGESDAFASVIASVAAVEKVRAWGAEALVKSSGDGPTPFHRDAARWPPRYRESLNAWIALDDVDVTNGCLVYAPGSHRQVPAEALAMPMGVLDGEVDRNSVQPVFCPSPVGSVCLHSGYVIHGAKANSSARPRRALSVLYAPESE